MNSRLWIVLSGVTIIVPFVVVPFALYFVKDGLPILNGFYGYLTIAIIGVVTNATFIIPTPTMMPVVVEIADRNSLFLIAGTYAFFAAFGESTGYFAGDFINKISAIRDSRIHQFLEEKMKGGKKTGVILFILAVFPVSPFDIGGAIAGNAGYPWRWFWVVTFIGRWLKYWYLIPFWEIAERWISKIPWVGNIAGLLMVVIFLIAILVANRIMNGGRKKIVEAGS
ncbi:MAG: hypothetical protein KJI69_00355 [Patescibacteria group bacterium]|nr:hypothetical protein [Patescibacteria group bacterium]